MGREVRLSPDFGTTPKGQGEFLYEDFPFKCMKTSG
jgi:hypothetical protein